MSTSLGVLNSLARLEGQLEQLGDVFEYGRQENLEHVRALYASLREVAVTLNVTVDILAAAGLLDVEVIRGRVAEQLAAPRRPDVTCVTCGRTVPAARATLTAVGNVCSSCSSP